MKEPTWQVPYCNGRPIWYCGGWERGVTYRPNTTFDAELYYYSFERGRSAAHLVFQDRAGATYHVFLKDFEDIMLQFGGLNGTSVSGTWTFCKRGQNYGVRLVQPKQEITVQ